ncbi:MAG: non-canonical purine NTP pyrophosphatase [Metallibacterium scheffleri]
MHGFGYDPVFLDSALDCSAAELDEVLKNRISHRARALTALRAQWPPRSAP